MEQLQDVSQTNLRKGWWVVMCAALFFFYEFIQLNLLNAINLDLMQAFHANATQIGRLGSIYFIANVVFLIPAGLLLDRFSTRKIILIAMLFCIVGTFGFSFTDSIAWAGGFRFLAGIGSAFCFLSSIRLASRWLPSSHMALASGLIVMMAMIGGLVAQTPLTLLVNAMGWRDAVVVDGFLGVLLFLVIAYVVRDYPLEMKNNYEALRQRLSNLGLAKSMRLSYQSRQNWACAIYTGLMNLPIFLLGALWGIPFLTQVVGLPDTHAAWVTSALFLGTLIGCPLIGEFSDFMERRRSLMLWGAIISFIIMCVLMYAPLHSVVGLMILFFLLGFFTSTQIISYPTVSESNSKARTASSVSIISLCAIGGGAIFQPIFGRLMDLHGYPVVLNGVPQYTPADYHIAFLIMPLAFIVAFLAALIVRETYARSIATDLD